MALKQRIIKIFMKNIITYGRCKRKIAKDAIIDCEPNNHFYFNVSSDAGRFEKLETGHLLLASKSYFAFGSRVNIRSGSTLMVASNARLKIGSNVFINNRAEIFCRNSITIGNDCSISRNCVIRDSDVHYVENKQNSKPITIGNHVWIGTNVIILKGVTIGDGTIIGAGSVVTRDIPSGVLACGNPAVVIRKIEGWQK